MSAPGMTGLRAPAELLRRRNVQSAIGAAFVLAVAALVLAPLVSLALLALRGDSRDLGPSCRLCAAGRVARHGAAARRRRGDHRRHRARHRVAGHRLSVSRARYAGLAAAAAARDADLHRRLRVRRPVRRARAGAVPARRRVVHQYPLARRRDLRDGDRALPLRLRRGARHVPDPERVPGRSRAHARRDAPHAGAPRRAAARAAGARGRPLARAARDAQRHRRERVSRRAHAHHRDLHHVAQPRQPSRRGADRVRDAAGGRRPDRARTVRPAQPALHRLGTPAARGLADRARRAGGGWGARRAVPRPGRVRDSCCPRWLPDARGDRARAAGRLRSRAGAPHHHHRRARRHRNRDRARTRPGRRDRGAAGAWPPALPAAFCVAGLGYAVPGTVLALGLLSPLVGVDEGINWVARTLDRQRRRVSCSPARAPRS